jgi:excisionase family DNA binding protein
MESPQNLPKLLTADEVAESVGLPKPTVYDLARRNIIPCIRAGKAVRFHPQRIKEWLDSGGSQVAI